jgi:hypothetical protein
MVGNSHPASLPAIGAGPGIRFVRCVPQPRNAMSDTTIILLLLATGLVCFWSFFKATKWFEKI